MRVRVWMQYCEFDNTPPFCPLSDFLVRGELSSFLMVIEKSFLKTGRGPFPLAEAGVSVELARIGEESARGGLSLMVGTATSTIIAALGVIVMARLLGPASYGLYSLAFVLPALFVAIADFGVSPALTRYSASLRSQQKYSRLASMIESGLFFKLVIGTVATLLAFGLSGQLAALALQRQDMGGLVAVASIMIIFQGFFNLSYNAFVGLDRMERGALMMILRDTVRMILSPTLIIIGFGIAGAILGQVFGWMLASILGIWVLLVYRQSFPEMGSDVEGERRVRADIGTMVSYGLPLYVGSILSVMLAQYQNIVLAFFTSNAEIGNFNAAVNFGTLIGIVATPVATSLFPAFSKLDLQTGKEELQRMFNYAVKYTTILILPLAILVATLSRDLIRAVYGTAYAYASTYLTLYVGIFLLTALGSQVVGNFLNGVGRTKETLKITAFQLAVFFPTAPVLALLFRVPGLIVALILSAAVAISYGLCVATRRYGMRVDLGNSLRTLGSALASTLPVVPIVYYSPLPSFANVLLGGSIYLTSYLTLVPLFRALKRSDLEILAPILGQIRILKPITNLIFAYETRVLKSVEGRFD